MDSHAEGNGDSGTGGLLQRSICQRRTRAGRDRHVWIHMWKAVENQGQAVSVTALAAGFEAFEHLQHQRDDM